jgi:hypothetical protein
MFLFSYEDYAEEIIVAYLCSQVLRFDAVLRIRIRDPVPF